MRRERAWAGKHNTFYRLVLELPNKFIVFPLSFAGEAQ